MPGTAQSDGAGVGSRQQAVNREGDPAPSSARPRRAIYDAVWGFFRVSLFNVRPGLWRARLLGGCSLLCLTLGMAHPTQALERRNPKSEASFYERFHVSLEGGWLTNASSDNFSFSGDVAAAGSLAPGRNGISAGGEVGGSFNPLYDWRARWRSNLLSTSTTRGTSITTSGSDTFLNNASANQRLQFHTFDGEIGYRPPQTPLRLFLGARMLKSNTTIGARYEQDKFGGGSDIGQGTHDAETFGIGPRAGLELTVPLSQPGAFASLNGSVAAIFAKRDHTFSGSRFVDFTFPSTTVLIAQDLSRNVTIINTEATASLGYRLTNNASFELGYRVQHFTNMVPVISQVNVGNISGVVSGNGSVLMHGPVGKLTIAWP